MLFFLWPSALFTDEVEPTLQLRATISMWWFLQMDKLLLTIMTLPNTTHLSTSCILIFLGILLMGSPSFSLPDQGHLLPQVLLWSLCPTFPQFQFLCRFLIERVSLSFLLMIEWEHSCQWGDNFSFSCPLLLYRYYHHHHYYCHSCFLYFAG